MNRLPTWIAMLAVAVACSLERLQAAEPLPANSNATVVPADHPERLARGTETFTRHVRGLLLQHCVECHGGGKVKGGLDLTTRELLLRGGDEGPAIVPFDARSSRLLQSIRHEREPHMPSKAPKLADADLAQVSRWIDDGAPYDRPLVEGRESADSPSARPRAPWWAFEPLKAVEPPEVRNASWVRTPIDRFILAPLEARGVHPAPAADRRTLLRRLHLDLLGLPPTPEEMEAFVADSAPTPEAARRVVRELLRRPQHGERWARYWLDVARFAESSGFEHDYDRPAAYHYRDFVIRAFNDDMPYDQFVRWQLAGDEFAPDEPLALMATGFLGAGVFPTQITANEVERTRYDAMDDMLATTGTAMLGLTIGCARCHDHKFDPVSSREYYQLLSTFTTTTRSELDLDLDPAVYRREKAEFDAAHEPLARAVSEYEARELPARFELWLAAGAPLPSRSGWRILEFAAARSEAGAGLRRLDDGSYLAEGKNGDHDRYTFVMDLDGPSVAALRVEALPDPSLPKGGPGRAENGNIGLSRIRLFTSAPGGGPTNEVFLRGARATFEQNTNSLSVASALDDNPRTGWAVDPKFGVAHAAAFTLARPIPSGSGLRLTVVLEFQLNTRHNIGRSRISVSPDADAPLEGGSIPAGVASILARAQTGFGFGFGSPLTLSERMTLRDWWRSTDPGWRDAADAAAAHLRSAPKPRLTKVLTCTEGNPPVRMHTQGADFFPETHYLHRGSTDQKRGVATQGFVQVLARVPDPERHWTWTPPAGSKVSGRRRTLANWMTDTEHGAGHLLARVAVNRLWQHHFGRGLVETPNDFGVQGSRPSHPELLDWLAGELIRQNWKLKPLHELILDSSAYQLSAERTASTSGGSVESGTQGDAVTRYRAFLPRRLTAEAIRDSLLFVSGALESGLYGPGTLDPSSRRRSIYFTVKRSQLVPAMQIFDAPEPLVSQAARPSTTVAPQALLLMNSPQARGWAAEFARRIAPDAATPPEQGVSRAYKLALGRSPSPSELQVSAQFVTRQAEAYRAAPETTERARELAFTDLAQAILSLNEFIYVE